MLSMSALLTLTACQKATDEPRPLTKSQEPSAQADMTEVTLLAETDLNEDLRGLQINITNHDSNGFTATLTGESLPMRMIFRSDDASLGVHSTVLSWKITSERTLSVQAQVNLPKGITDAVKNGRQTWYASCILAHQMQYQDMSYDQNTHQLTVETKDMSFINADITQIPVLYMMPWTKLQAKTTDVDGKNLEVLHFSGSKLKPMGHVARFHIYTEPATFHLARFVEAPAPPSSGSDPGDGWEGEETSPPIDITQPKQHSDEVVFYEPFGTSNPDFFDLGESTLEEQIERVQQAINWNALKINSFFAPKTLSISGNLSGHYDFATSPLAQGALPSFTASPKLTHEAHLSFGGEFMWFDSDKYDKGFIYIWIGGGNIEVSGTLDASLSATDVQRIQNAYRWPEAKRWTAGHGEWYTLANVSGILGGHGAVTPASNLGFDQTKPRMDGIWDFNSLGVKTTFGPVTLSPSQSKTKHYIVRYQPKAYIKKLPAHQITP